MSFFSNWFSGVPTETSRLSPQDTLKESYKKIEEIQGSAANFKVPTSEKLPWEQHGVFAYFDSPLEKLEWEIKKYKRLLQLDPTKDEWVRVPSTLFKRTWGGLQNSSVKEQIEAKLATRLLDLEVRYKKLKKNNEFKEQFKDFLTGYGPDNEYDKCHWVKHNGNSLVKKTKKNSKNPRGFTSNVETGQSEFFERSLVSKFPGSVGHFVRNEDDVKLKTSVFLKQLEMSIPKNDQEAALFYKYIVKGKTPNWDYFNYLPYVPPNTDTSSDKYDELGSIDNLYEPSNNFIIEQLDKSNVTLSDVNFGVKSTVEELQGVNTGVNSTINELQGANANLSDIKDEIYDSTTEIQNVSEGVEKLNMAIAKNNFKKKATPIVSPQMSPEQTTLMPQGSPGPSQTLLNKESPEQTPLKAQEQDTVQTLNNKYTKLNEFVEKYEGPDSVAPMMEAFLNVQNILRRLKTTNSKAYQNWVNLHGFNEDTQFQQYMKDVHGQTNYAEESITPEKKVKTPQVSPPKISEKELQDRMQFENIYGIMSTRKDLSKQEIENMNNIFNSIKSNLTANQQIDWNLAMKSKEFPLTPQQKEPLVNVKKAVIRSGIKKKPTTSRQKATQELFGITPEKKNKTPMIASPFKSTTTTQQEKSKTLSPEESDDLQQIALKEKELLDELTMRPNRNFNPMDQQQAKIMKKYRTMLEDLYAKKGYSPQTITNRILQDANRFQQRIEKRTQKLNEEFIGEATKVRNNTPKLMSIVDTPEKATIAYNRLFKNLNPTYPLEFYNLSNSTTNVQTSLEPDLEQYDSQSSSFTGPHKEIDENLKKLEGETLKEQERNEILGKISTEVVNMLNKIKFNKKEAYALYGFNTALVLGKLAVHPDIPKDYLGLILNSSAERLKMFQKSLFQNHQYTVKIPIGE